MKRNADIGLFTNPAFIRLYSAFAYPSPPNSLQPINWSWAERINCSVVLPVDAGVGDGKRRIAWWQDPLYFSDFLPQEMALQHHADDGLVAVNALIDHILPHRCLQAVGFFWNLSWEAIDQNGLRQALIAARRDTASLMLTVS